MDEFISNVEPTIGSIVRVQRQMGYYHYGVVVGEDLICHYSGETNDDINNPENIKVRTTNLESFIKGGILEVKLHNEEMLNTEEILKRCYEYMGNDKFMGMQYNLVNNNCEHFARWACEDNVKSKQVDEILDMFMSLFK